ncbi:MAG: hypothetical protein IJC16_01025 [Rikenellaceae bacterium]|nr:hypothetical protein [Rikenellaceae bacterium]
MKTRYNKLLFPDYFEGNALKAMRYLDTLRPVISHGFARGPLRTPVVLQTQNLRSNGLMMLAPKRMELIVAPSLQTEATPWLKQLTAHEYRHAVQYNAVNRGTIRVLSWLLGQQGLLVGVGLMPIWMLEGDATLAETQLTSFGRALQPSFTLEYRAYLDGDGKMFKTDKWFCGSYKDFIPDHYQLGYQLVAWSYERYGPDIWDRVARYTANYPFTLFTTSIALRKYYKTSVGTLLRESFGDLRRYWNSLPQLQNSGTLIDIPARCYTTYANPVAANDSTIIALKSDFDRFSRLVAIDTRTRKERMIRHTGIVSTQPALRDSTLYWSEFRASTLWAQRVNSQVVSLDLRTGRMRADRRLRTALYPTPLPDGTLATVNYRYDGSYFLDVSGVQHDFPDSISVHGLAYDERTATLAFIGLSDAGMWFGAIDRRTGAIRPITRPSRVTVYNLRAGDGRLYFNSIQSGRDEIHQYDLATGQEYRISTSRYGSVGPSVAVNDTIAFTTYTREGYRLARQRIDTAALEPVNWSELPRNVVNPPRRQWNLMNIDTIDVSDRPEGTRIRKYRKGLNQVNVHSWMPVSFNPFSIRGEQSVNLNWGVTAMSQNLLSSTTMYANYAHTKRGHLGRLAIQYNEWAPKIELSTELGGGRQLVYRDNNLRPLPDGRKAYFKVSGLVYLPLTLSSGYHMRTLIPQIQMSHYNARVYDPDRQRYRHGLQQMIAAVQFSDNVRMATRDYLPRWGYYVKAVMASAPFNGDFGTIWGGMGRMYLPGIGPQHSITLRGAFQYQTGGSMHLRYKDVFPRGAEYEFAAQRYGAFSADYQLPVWCPDGGWNGIIYFKRIRTNFFFDYARYRRFDRQGHVSLNSYGGSLILDVNPVRLPAASTITLTLSVYKPSDRRGCMFDAGFSVPF